MRRTAQNFRIDLKAVTPGDNTGANTSGGGSGNNAGNNSNSSTGSNTGSSSTKTTGASSTKTSTASQTASITCRFTFVDSEGNPVKDLNVELHSDVKTGKTDGEGKLTISNVEMGDHTLSVTDADGNGAASKTFKLKEGSKFVADGDTLTVVNGSTVDITVVYDGSTLSFGSAVQDGPSPKTADNTHVALWMSMFIICSMGLMAAATQKKGKHQR